MCAFLELLCLPDCPVLMPYRDHAALYGDSNGSVLSDRFHSLGRYYNWSDGVWLGLPIRIFAGLDVQDQVPEVQDPLSVQICEISGFGFSRLYHSLQKRRTMVFQALPGRNPDCGDTVGTMEPDESGYRPACFARGAGGNILLVASHPVWILDLLCYQQETVLQSGLPNGGAAVLF